MLKLLIHSDSDASHDALIFLEPVSFYLYSTNITPCVIIYGSNNKPWHISQND